jgi:peptidoglycan/LPS O-acetylase OafA/YrhL
MPFPRRRPAQDGPVNADNALQYALAGFFALIFASPLLAFWRPKAWARTTVIVTLLLSIAYCMLRFDLDQADNPQVAMLIITILPAVLAGSLAGLLELIWWRARAGRRDRMQRHYGHHRRSTSAPGRGDRR